MEFDGPDLWEHFRKILVLPHAASALRAMHRLGLLDLLFKEFQLIDSLVIRDYYHRYTVDEHSLVTIENLHSLSARKGDLDRRFRDILARWITPELLYLSLLFHDVGKGMPNESHVEGSLEAVQGVFERLRLDTFGRETVNFLIANHLRMSATLLRRDIFDPEAVHDFAEDRGHDRAPEDADALHLRRHQGREPGSADALESGDAVAALRRDGKLSESFRGRPAHVRGRRGRQQLERLIPTGRRRGRVGEIPEFPGRFPKRYLLTHSSAEISAHYRMYRRLGHSVGGNQRHQAR